VFTLPILAHPCPAVTDFNTLVNGLNKLLANPVKPGSSASANSEAKHKGFAAAWAAV